MGCNNTHTHTHTRTHAHTQVQPARIAVTGFRGEVTVQ